MTTSDWFTEILHTDQRQQLRIGTYLFQGNTLFQKVEIFENSIHGRVLCLDGIVQTTEGDEANYHEMLVHPLMFSHGYVRHVLIIGGADGGALREVLRHPVARVVLVDIDSELITLCRRFLPSISAGAYDDPRVEIRSGDGAELISQMENSFDAVIIDSTDPIGNGKALFQEQFYRSCRHALRTGGMIVTQNGVPYYQAENFIKSNEFLRSVFSDAGFYISPVPAYIGGFMAFGWGSDSINPRNLSKEELEQRIISAAFRLKVYNAEVHFASFAFPNWIADLQPISQPGAAGS